MGGAIADALTGLGELYDRGGRSARRDAGPVGDRAFLTRVKVAPDAEGFFDGSSREAKRGRLDGRELSMASLTRAWSLLLKGLFEVRDAARPVAACEMALIRLSYAVDLPPTDRLVRDLLEGDAQPPPRTSPPPPAGGGTRTHSVRVRGGGRSIVGEPLPQRPLPPCAPSKTSPRWPARSRIEDSNRNNVHLVSLEPGRLEFRPRPARTPDPCRRSRAESSRSGPARAGW